MNGQWHNVSPAAGLVRRARRSATTEETGHGSESLPLLSNQFRWPSNAWWIPLPGQSDREVQQKGVVCHLVSPDSALEIARMIPSRDEDLGATQHPVWTTPD